MALDGYNKRGAVQTSQDIRRPDGLVVWQQEATDGSIYGREHQRVNFINSWSVYLNIGIKTSLLCRLNRLQQNGFTAKEKHYRLRVLIVTTDSVARPIVCGTTQFNGAFGCSFCLIEGKHVKKGAGYARVYLEPSDESERAPLRSLEQHNADLKEVLRTGKKLNGILSSTPLARLVGFDHVKALVPEYLHSCCEGVFNLLIELWTTRKNSKNIWYVGDKVNIVNGKLSNIEPPYEVTRTTAGIDKLKVWKASMFRSFTLYYFPIFEEILPAVYFQHFCQLAYGMSLLLRERVSVADIKKVDVLFKQFVREFEMLYGVEDVRINVHFLTHLPQSVLDWGCLWSSSTFIPEWFNGELNNLFHGSQGVVDQMASNYLMRLEVRREAAALNQSKSLPPHVASKLREFLNLPEADDISKGVLVNGGKVKLLGNFESREVSDDEEVAFRNLFSHTNFRKRFAHVDPYLESFGICHSYPVFKVVESGSRFTTSSYTLSPKRSNYCALLVDGSHVFIDSIVRLDVSRDCAFILGRKLGIDGKRTFTPDPIGDVRFTSYPQDTTELHGIDTVLTAYPVGDVVNKCVLCLKNTFVNTYIATGLVNPFETD